VIERALCYVIPYGEDNPSDTDIEWVLLTQGLMQMGFSKRDGARVYELRLSDIGDYISVTRCDDGAFELYNGVTSPPASLRTTCYNTLLERIRIILIQTQEGKHG